MVFISDTPRIQAIMKWIQTVKKDLQLVMFDVFLLDLG